MAKPEKVFIRTPYNYDRDAASDESGAFNDEESMTDQQFAEEADINTIAQRFGLFGEVPQGVRAPVFGDFSEVVDYHTAMNAVAAANEAFEEMPAAVRARFNNDPGAFVEFCSDEKNRGEAEKLGLLVPQREELSRDAVRNPPAAPAVEAPVAPDGPVST